MKINNKIKLLILLFILIGVGFFYFFNSIISKDKFRNLKDLLSVENREIVKKYVFPYKLISQQQQKLSAQKRVINPKALLALELSFKESNTDIKTTKSSFEMANKKILNKHLLHEGFYLGIYNAYPGSGYIDFYGDDLFILSSVGVLAYTRNISDNYIFKQIRNNIGEFIGEKQFKKSHKFSLKDLFIYKDKIFISYTEEKKEDCWNTGIIFGDINYENIKFEKLFSSKECIHSINNIDNEFEVWQSGGRIVDFDKDNILLSIGDYRERHFAQNKDSVNGKIIKININNSNYEIISMGHRNPQGLYFDKENNFIIETEHGPMGGDEINLIEVEKINKDEILNYGWPVVSAGEHYGGKNPKRNKIKYEKYPLYKSHSEHGFIEPLKSFVPSIGISEIVKIKKNKYVASSLRNKSLYFFEINKDKKISNLERLEVAERIRDLRFNDNKLYMFLEDTASIGVLNLN